MIGKVTQSAWFHLSIRLFTLTENGGVLMSSETVAKRAETVKYAQPFHQGENNFTASFAGLSLSWLDQPREKHPFQEGGKRSLSKDQQDKEHHKRRVGRERTPTCWMKSGMQWT